MRPSDSAAADLLGTYLLMGLTVALAVGFSTLVFSNLATTPSAPHATLEVEGGAGSRLVNVTHAGGEPLAMDAIAVEWRVAGDVAAATLLGKTGDAATWRPGETLRYQLAAPLATGETATARVALASTRALVAVASRTLPSTAVEAPPAAPTLSAITVSPAVVPSDGTTPAVVRVRVTPPHGFALLQSAVVDLSSIGLGVVPMRDDGMLGDATPADGEYAVQIKAPSGLATNNYAIIARAWESGGAVGSQGGTIGIVRPTGGSGGGSGAGSGGGAAIATKVTTGIAFTGLPSSANVTKFRVYNLTWDQQIPTLLQNDILLIKVTDKSNRSWTADVQFEPRNGQLAIKGFDIYSVNGGCSWAPPQPLILTGPIDLLYPPATGTLGNPQSNSPLIPGGLPACSLVRPNVYTGSYANAGLTDPVTVTVLRLGENTGADEKTALVNADFSFG